MTLRHHPDLDKILDEIRPGVSIKDVADRYEVSPKLLREMALRAGKIPKRTLQEARAARADRIAAKIAERKERAAALAAYYATLARKIRELREAGYDWHEIGSLLHMHSTTSWDIGVSHYPELRRYPRHTRHPRAKGNRKTNLHFPQDC